MNSTSSSSAAWVDDFFSYQDNFPRPDWEKIYEYVDKNISEQDLGPTWETIADVWMSKVIAELGDAYAAHESKNFILVSSQDKKYNKRLLKFLEKSLKLILKNLDGIASDEGYGKHIALVFGTEDEYYSYIFYFYPDGEHSFSSGIYLSRGYGHFALPYTNLTEAEPTVAHELTHACLAHLPIPLWLNEGFAVSLEDTITGSWPLRMDKDQFNKHKKFWGKEEIQEFWSGKSFGRPDQGSTLSYELARFAIKSLSHDYDRFREFALHASYEDGGEEAAIKYFGGSLGGLIEQFFGEGEWTPLPSSWYSDQNNTD